MNTSPKAPISEPTSGSRKDAEASASANVVEGVAVGLRAVSHGFADIDVIDALDLAVAPGEVLGLVGPSGCGKSTLLELVGGLLEQSSGTIAVGAGTSAEERLAGCAHMPQRDLLLPWLTALDNAALAPRNRGESKRSARELARPLFERFGLAGFESARPAALSGGMRQRVAFLRTLLARKPVLLLDEPFASLDAITRAEMQEWLATALAAEPATAVVVTHDVEEALYLCDRVAVLSARPARVLGTVISPAPRRAPRAEIVTSPEFGTVRERALELLSEGSS
jgi:NitT/TauT family transport system ATP-binding protein